MFHKTQRRPNTEHRFPQSHKCMFVIRGLRFCGTHSEERQELEEGAEIVVSQQYAMCISGTNLLQQFYTLPSRQYLQIKLAISPSNSILTPALPVPALTLWNQAHGRVATRVPMFKTSEWHDLRKQEASLYHRLSRWMPCHWASEAIHSGERVEGVERMKTEKRYSILHHNGDTSCGLSYTISSSPSSHSLQWCTEVVRSWIHRHAQIHAHTHTHTHTHTQTHTQSPTITVVSVHIVLISWITHNNVLIKREEVVTQHSLHMTSGCVDPHQTWTWST